LPLPSDSTWRKVVMGNTAASTCPPLKAATMLGMVCNGTMVSPLVSTPCLRATISSE
jgi:hypothetical protein